MLAHKNDALSLSNGRAKKLMANLRLVGDNESK